MTALDLLIGHLEAALSEARAMQAERAEPAATEDWIDAPTAAKRFEMSKKLVQSWCLRNDGFGQKRGGRWYVSISKMKAKLGIA